MREAATQPCRHTVRSVPIAASYLSTPTIPRLAKQTQRAGNFRSSAARSTASGVPAPAVQPAGPAEQFHGINQIGRIEIAPVNVILRSRAKRGVSKDGRRHDLAWGPSFETRASFDKLRSALLRTRRMDCVDMIRTSERPQCPPDNSLLFPARATLRSLFGCHDFPARVATEFTCNLFRSLSLLRSSDPGTGRFLRNSLIKSLIAGNWVATALRLAGPQACRADLATVALRGALRV
jgi:hypothetical protein